jgi:hypothetical protein
MKTQEVVKNLQMFRKKEKKSRVVFSGTADAHQADGWCPRA